MLWIKALHIISMVCWFAGLFYLPRIFVYHASTQDPRTSETFKVMEHKLFYYIMNPSAICTAIFGFWMIFLDYDNYSHMMWLHIKLILVLVLVVFHAFCWKYLIDFKNDRNKHDHKFYRYFNEVPSIILIIVILLTILKPSF